MSRLRLQVLSDTECEEPDALSSPGPHSSPTLHHRLNPADGILFTDLSEASGDNETDSDYAPDPQTPVKRPSPMSNADKTDQTLTYMREHFSRFSVRQFFETLLTSEEPRIKNISSMFISGDGMLSVLDLLWERCGGLGNVELTAWAVEKAGLACAKEASWLSDRASEGPHEEDSKFLRVSPQDINIDTLNNFRTQNLGDYYERATPNLQVILKAIIAKDRKVLALGSRDPDAGRVLMTSMALNLRSRKLNYHAALNGILFWDNRVPKRLVQMFNHLGVTASYKFQVNAITSLSKDSIRLAREAANDSQKIKMLPYDNFNWTLRAWEATALHGSITHDEVSALLVILPAPDGCDASKITNVPHFLGPEGTRHKISTRKSLTDILPTHQDQTEFRKNSIIHVLHILVEEISSCAQFSSSIPAFDDPTAIPPRKTEEYYLPTFDQEQGSTRGNMVVLEHYFGKVLAIPKDTFEHTMFTVLGDRLTTVRDRAAQDQRAVDRSAYRFDHLSSFAMVSGLMHFSLNFIHALGANYWGKESDLISLSAFSKVLPNCTEINLRKVDYYAWLRFLDIILRGLIIQAALRISNVETLDHFHATDLDLNLCSYSQFLFLATSIVDSYLLPSTGRLEVLGIKTLKGNTKSGHSILLMHDLMTLREMQHSVKHGHPQRIQRMIKYWMPMFYAAGSHNYANECMEILHNVIHDWPADFATIAFNGMLVNPSGKPDGWKPTDIRVEHLNDKIKERAHGSNATPAILEKITPALGHVQALTDQIFEDLGVEKINQHHASVSQHKDVEIITRHLYKSNIFDFANDLPSTQAVVDLYRTGCQRLAGKNGGHVKHLNRHSLRLRSRHGTIVEAPDIIDSDVDTQELILATDAVERSYIIGSEFEGEQFD